MPRPHEWAGGDGAGGVDAVRGCRAGSTDPFDKLRAGSTRDVRRKQNFNFRGGREKCRILVCAMMGTLLGAKMKY
jgi:hypothetical protein